MTGGLPSVGVRAKLFERLEVIDDPQPRDAAFNMAADEALLAGLTNTALLRFYRWQRPAVSFGYFDEAEPVIRAHPEREIVRRWTGGGLVAHGKDFTYSLLLPRSHPLTHLRAAESYRLLHGVLAAAIAEAGPDLPALEQEALPGEAISRACFVNAVRHDLLLAGEKVAGAAQRRTRQGWLHQGSVQLPGERAGLYERLRQTLPPALAAEVRARPLQPDEEDAAKRLSQAKYGTAGWLRRC